MSYWSEIKNTYEETAFNAVIDGAVVKSISIDAWREGNENGSVIAKVILTTSDDVCVIYNDNIARTDTYAQEVIQEAVQAIKRSD